MSKLSGILAAVLFTLFASPGWPQVQATATPTLTDLAQLPEWNLNDLYTSPSSGRLAADILDIKASCEAFAADYRGKVDQIVRQPEAGAVLATAIRRYDHLIDRLGRVFSYAKLLYSKKMSDTGNAKLYQDIQERYSTAADYISFFPVELNRIDFAVLKQVTMQKEMVRWQPWIELLGREKPHQISPELEQLFDDKSLTSQNGWRRLFDETIASMRFHINENDLGLESALGLMQERNEEVRREAAASIATTLQNNIRIFVFVTNMLAKDKAISDQWRSFNDPSESRHLSNRVTDQVIDDMVDSVRTSYPRLSHRYYSLKAKWLGKERLDFWDLNAPLPSNPIRVFPWTEAREIVSNTFQRFSPQMAKIAGRFFNENWIDAPIRLGKAPGAFSYPAVPSSHPYILLNYRGRARDVVTLAHEVGHGVHQYLAASNGALLSPTPVTLAETVAAFSEMLVFQALLEKAEDIGQRRAMLAARVEHSLNAILRQVAFYSFEKEVHRRRSGGELTADELADIWIGVQREVLGPSVNLTAEYRVFWSYIPQFVHTPFYVYSYPFGNLLGNVLYRRYESAPDGFAQKYLDLLAAGNTKDYADLLSPFGLDVYAPGFWDIGLAMVSTMISELEMLEQQE
jgi:oligoendopeptidase F